MKQKQKGKTQYVTMRWHGFKHTFTVLYKVLLDNALNFTETAEASPAKQRWPQETLHYIRLLYYMHVMLRLALPSLTLDCSCFQTEDKF